jgi:pimeloyl-ACP methyl ester carboxylesterase
MKKQIVTTLVLVLTAISISFAQSKPKSSGYAPVNGQKVYYEIYGQGKPLVLLHGAYMTIGLNWGQLIPELAKTHQVIALEVQGHGHTAWTNRPLNYETLADDVDKTLQHLKIDSADIVGYSYGGTIAYALAIKSPKRVKKLVIISST